MRRGVTVAELLISLAILGVVGVVVVGLFLQLLNASTKGVDQAVALDLAESKLEETSAYAPESWTFANQEAVSVTDSRTPTTFQVQLTASNVTEAPNTMGDTYRLDVQVSWWAEQPNVVAERRGQGRLSVRLSRLVYYENMK